MDTLLRANSPPGSTRTTSTRTGGLQDAVAALIAGFDNPVHTATEAAVRGRMKFHAPAPDATIDWDAAAAAAGALAKI